MKRKYGKLDKSKVLFMEGKIPHVRGHVNLGAGDPKAMSIWVDCPYCDKQHCHIWGNTKDGIRKPQCIGTSVEPLTSQEYGRGYIVEVLAK